MLLKKSNKKIRFASLLLLGIFLAAAIALQLLAKRQVAKILSERIPDYLKLEYTDLKVNMLMGNMQIENVSLNFLNQDTAKRHTRLKMDRLTVEGFSFWQYLVHNVVEIDELLFKNPKTIYYPYPNLSEKDSVSGGSNKLDKPIKIGDVKIRNGSITILQQKTDSINLEAKTINFSLSDFKMDSISIKNKIPFTYDTVALSAEHFFVDMGPYERLKIKTLTLKNRILKTTELAMQPKYGKRELSGILKKERDHIILEIPEIELDGIDFGFKDGIFFVRVNQGSMQHPKLEIYRDKLVADDLEKKRLYSQMLRELPINLTISKLEVNKGQLGYAELVNANTKAGRLFFDGINAQLENISNTYKPNEKTIIAANALFMGNATMTLDWSFDVNSIDDAFRASGTFIDLDAESINPFLESNMRSRAQGQVDEIYFTISGNSTSSRGDMKMKYNDFEFVILKKNRLGIDKVLTAIGNIFVKGGSKTNEQKYRYGKIEAERDPTKSFFNYLWINVRNGLGSTLTGDGKKK